MVTYRAFGLVLAAPRSLSFERLEGRAPDVALVRREEVDTLPDAPEIHRLEDQTGVPEPVVRQRGGRIAIEHMDCAFVFGPGTGRIEFHDHGRSEPQAFRLMVERVVLPLYLLLGQPGFIALHGSAIAASGGAWVFIGDPRAGKSTTAHALLAPGASLLADDLSLIDVGRCMLRPGPPVLHLWRESGSVAEAEWDEALIEGSDKRWFRLRDRAGRLEPTPLERIVLLDPREESGVPEFEVLAGRDAAAALVSQCFDLSDPPREWAEQRFRQAVEISRRVPVERYRYTRSADGRPSHVGALQCRLA
jgi:hypothetical protein